MRKNKQIKKGFEYDSLSEHCFYVLQAEKYGVPAAIIYSYIRARVKTNYEDKRNCREINGVKYNFFYNPVKDFLKIWPYLSDSTIDRTLITLEENGEIIVKEQNKLRIDRTKWYTTPVDEEKTIELESSQKRYFKVLDAIEYNVNTAICLDELSKALITYLSTEDDYEFEFDKLRLKKIYKRIPFLSDKTIRRNLELAEQEGYIEISRQNGTMSSYRFTSEWFDKHFIK